MLSKDGMNLFRRHGKSTREMEGARFALGNPKFPTSKQFRLAVTSGLQGLSFVRTSPSPANFSPVLAKQIRKTSFDPHAKVRRRLNDMMRNFKPMVEAVWSAGRDLASFTRRCRPASFIYRSVHPKANSKCLGTGSESPRSLLKSRPRKFQCATMLEPFPMPSLPRSKELAPIPQYRATGQARRIPGSGMSARFRQATIVATPGILRALCGSLGVPLSPTLTRISRRLGRPRRGGPTRKMNVPRSWVFRLLSA